MLNNKGVALLATALLVSLCPIAHCAQVAEAKDQKVSLKVGDQAPLMKVGSWAQGTPIKGFEKGKVYVVEFWASWCGPCFKAMPHLSELSKKHAAKAVFTGVDVWEDQKGGYTAPAIVKKFLADNPGRITYNVAVDGQDAWMGKNWLTAAGKNSIPTAFVVDQNGKIAFIGHPMDLTNVLQPIIDGKFDPVAYAKRPAQPDFLPLYTALQKKDFDTLKNLASKMASEWPVYADMLNSFQTVALAGKDLKAGNAAVDQLIKDKKEEELANLGMSLMGVEGMPTDFYKLAVKSFAAASGSKLLPPSFLKQLLAEAYFKAGDKAKAIESAKEALAAAKADKTLPAEFAKRIEEMLAKFEKA